MNKKIILILVPAILISISLTYFIIDYMETERQNNQSHNNKFVKNYTLGGPDKVVPLLLIENKTHHFDLDNCIWIKN